MLSWKMLLQVDTGFKSVWTVQATCNQVAWLRCYVEV